MNRINKPNVALRVIIAALVFVLPFCGGSETKAPIDIPDWINDPFSIAPDGSTLYFVGDGDTQEKAIIKAYEFYAHFLCTRVESSFEELNLEINGDLYKRSESRIKVQVAENVSGAAINQLFFYEEQKTHYIQLLVSGCNARDSIISAMTTVVDDETVLGTIQEAIINQDYASIEFTEDPFFGTGRIPVNNSTVDTTTIGKVSQNLLANVPPMPPAPPSLDSCLDRKLVGKWVNVAPDSRFPEIHIWEKNGTLLYTLVKIDILPELEVVRMERGVLSCPESPDSAKRQFVFNKKYIILGRTIYDYYSYSENNEALPLVRELSDYEITQSDGTVILDLSIQYTQAMAKFRKESTNPPDKPVHSIGDTVTYSDIRSTSYFDYNLIRELNGEALFDFGPFYVLDCFTDRPNCQVMEQVEFFPNNKVIKNNVEGTYQVLESTMSGYELDLSFPNDCSETWQPFIFFDGYIIRGAAENQFSYETAYNPFEYKPIQSCTREVESESALLSFTLSLENSIINTNKPINALRYSMESRPCSINANFIGAAGTIPINIDCQYKLEVQRDASTIEVYLPLPTDEVVNEPHLVLYEMTPGLLTVPNASMLEKLMYFRRTTAP